VSTSGLLFDLAGRGSVVLTGKDRAGFLHGLVTNDVKTLAPGQGCAAVFLTAKGKLLAECVVLCEADRLVLDTPPELSATVESLLRTYLVFNDVTIANETEETHVFHLAPEADGDAAEDFLRRAIGPGARCPLPERAHASVAAQFTFKEDPPSPGAAAGGAPLRAAGGGAIRVVRENRTGVPGFDVRCPSSLSEEVRRVFLSAGARTAAEAELESLRIAAGIPRWGAELTESVLPDEAGLRERGFVAENKGCYVGQEIVARIRTYGHVNRRLVRLEVAGGVPKPGERILFENEECGAVTSATASGAPNAALALAYLKRGRGDVGTSLTISSFAGTLSASVLPGPLA
jgi:folate-binding protein YgfZ